MSIFKLPSFIDEFLLKNNYQYIELIQKSERKETYVIKIKKNNIFFILKAFSNESPQIIKNKFKAEIEFYQTDISSYLPKLILCTVNILILEYIPGITLRELLIQKNFNEDIQNQLFTSIEQFYLNHKNNVNSVCDFNNAYAHLAALSSSGPIQTKYMKINFLNRILNKFTARFLQIKLKFLLRGIDTSNLMPGVVHGDFHYNNIIITKSQVKFIDFENINYNGFFIFDFLYLLVMIEIYIRNEEHIYPSFKKKLHKVLDDNTILKSVYALYLKAILQNKRFISN